MITFEDRIEYCKENLKIGNLYYFDMEDPVSSKFRFSSYLEKTYKLKFESEIVFLGFMKQSLYNTERDIAIFYSLGKLSYFDLTWFCSTITHLVPYITKNEFIFLTKKRKREYENY